MKILSISIVLVAVLFAAQATPAPAQDARFFRIAGPVPTTVTSLAADGTVTWTNQITNATFTVQTTTALPGGWMDYVQVPASNAVTMHRLFDPNPPSGMAFIPAGSFTMGDASDGDSLALPLHTAYVSAFYMDRYDVTKALWDDVYNWAITHGYSFDNPGCWSGQVNYSKGLNHPVYMINWYDMVKWCNARSEKEGRAPAYYTSAAQTAVYRTGQVDVQNDWVKWNSGYRLPTETEWEKAARGGNGKRFPSGDTITHSQANYVAFPGNYAYDVSPTAGPHPTFNDGVYPYTNPVAYFAPNGYGLYDMAGNVWQWCWDWYGSYGSASQTDPRGPSSGSNRVYRGGSWNDYAILCRAADRSYFTPDHWNNWIGFRSVLPPGQ
jgi:formylglycine-generating enzyme